MGSGLVNGNHGIRMFIISILLWQKFKGHGVLNPMWLENFMFLFPFPKQEQNDIWKQRKTFQEKVYSHDKKRKIKHESKNAKYRDKR